MPVAVVRVWANSTPGNGASDGSPFTLEAFQHFRAVNQCAVEHLDGNVPVQLGVTGLVDIGHTATANVPNDFIFSYLFAYQDSLPMNA